MTRDVPTVPENGCLDAVFKVMQQRGGTRFVGVVDPNKRLLGYITAENLAELVMIRSAREPTRAGRLHARLILLTTSKVNAACRCRLSCTIAWSLPLIGAPLFIVSVPELVIAQCKAGIVGSFPALNARPKELLEEWIVQIKTELADYSRAHPDARVAPFAVNQIVHASNDRLEHDIAVCVKHQVPIMITSLRAPQAVVEAAHSYGGIVLHDVINVRHARKAAEAGVDGLILVCAGAGGHAGTLSPFALMAEVRSWFKGTIVLSGSIANGAAVLAAQAMGADLAYVGTRFIATREANAKPEYKQMLIDTSAADIVYTLAVLGRARQLPQAQRRGGRTTTPTTCRPATNPR